MSYESVLSRIKAYAAERAARERARTAEELARHEGRRRPGELSATDTAKHLGVSGFYVREFLAHKLEPRVYFTRAGRRRCWFLIDKVEALRVERARQKAERGRAQVELREARKARRK